MCPLFLYRPAIRMHQIPLSSGEPLPHRKVIRSWLVPINKRSTPYAITLLVFDYLLLAAAFTGVIALHGAVVKTACGLAAGFVIGRLFIIGHDACHQSLTRRRTLNKWLGRIAFLPSLTPYSLWDVGHNVVHHGYTNLKGLDFVWSPLSLEEFRALSPGRRLLERIYRSGWGPGLYYLVEIWWRRMMFPSRKAMPTRRRTFMLDCALVSVFGLAWIGALVATSHITGQVTGLLLVTGFAVPFLVWGTMMGFVVYVHHTHQEVAWYTDRAEWARSQPFVSTTVHLTFPYRVGALLHHIMEHTAHHVDMSVPLYCLVEAQRRLETLLPGRIIVQPFSWRWYRDTVRHCKLYDFAAHAWTGFDGRPSPCEGRLTGDLH